MKFTIYSKDGGVVRYSGYPKYVGTYLGVPYLEFASIESPTPINWEKGDFINYFRTNQTYYLHSIPQPKKQARSGEYGAAFVYSNVKFYSEVKDLEATLFRDVVSEDNAVHFSTRADVNTFENVYGIATRIQENLDDLLPGKWKIEVVATDNEELKALLNEAKEFSVSNGNCLDALTQIYEVWQNVGWTYSWKEGKHTITIGSTYFRTEDNTTSSYGYGKGQGLTSLKKATSNEEDFATRLYVYGSERNIQTRYYNNFDIHNKDSVNIVNLMIPLDKWGKTDGLPDARKAYIQADDATIAKYGIIPKIVYFDGSENDEIYPSINGLTYSEVRKAIQDSGESVGVYLPDDIDTRIDLVYGVNNPTDGGTKVDVEKNRTFSIGLESHIGFNIAEQGKLTSEGVAVIAMKTGMCAGREFRVKNQIYAPNNGAILELERAWDESLGMGFPNKTYPISKGDQFVLLDIPMPEFYITIAQNKLYEAGQRLLERNSKLIPFYEPSIDTIVAIKDDKSLREGMYMQIQDNDIIESEDKKAYILIDSITIDEKGELPSYKVTLREQKRVAMSLGTLQGEIKDAKKDVEENSEKQARRVMFAASEVSTSVNNISNLLSSMWSLEGDTIVAKRDVLIKANLVVEGDTSSGGEGEDTPSAGIYGIRVNGTLHEDTDGDGIIDLGIIEGGGDIDIDLSDYVTRQELEKNNFATQSFVTTEIAKIDLSPYAKTTEVESKIAALKIGDYAKKSEVYTKEQTYNREHIDGEFEEYENALATKALKSEVYTKEETYDRTHIDSEFEDVENALAVRALKSEVYTKEQTYTQTEVDAKITNIGNSISTLAGNIETNTGSINTLGTRMTTAEGAIQSIQLGKADKGTKLSDYGITDAYTKEYIDSSFADFRSADTALGNRITPLETWKTDKDKFFAKFYLGADGNVYCDTNLIISGDTSSGGNGGGGGTTGGGGMTDEEKEAYALKEWVTNGFNPRITSSNKLDVSLIYGLGALATKNSLSYSDVGVTKSVITSLIGTTTYAPYNANGYLPLSGGTIEGNGAGLFAINRKDGNPVIEFRSNGSVMGRYGFTTDGTPIGVVNGSQVTLIHSGNIGSYNAGSADVIAKTYKNESINYGAESRVRLISLTASNSIDLGGPKQYVSGLSVMSDYVGWQLVSGASEWDNTDFYIRKLTDKGTYLAWKQIAFTDSNVASATKLQTARTIWGQSFDGTGNVDGYMYMSGLDVLHLDDSNLWLNFGAADVGKSLRLCGNDVAIYYGKSSNFARAMTINSSGNVTIGGSDLASTTYKMYVSGRINATTGIRIGGASHTSGLYPESSIGGGTGDNNDLWLYTTKGLYIYGSSINIKNALSVSGATTLSSTLTMGGNIQMSTNKIGWYGDASNYYIGYGYDLGSSAPNARYVAYNGHLFKAGGKTALTINSSGAVTMSNELFLSNNMGIYFKNASGSNVLAMYVDPSNVLQIGYNNIDSVAFQKPVTMSSTLEVGGIVTCNSHLSVRGSAYVYGNLDVAEKVTFANGMEVTGTSILGYVEASDISASRNIECTNLIANGDTSSGSDIRFKDIIENKTIKIEDIANAPLFTFKWNDRNDDGIHLGSSAQYWEAITPELVCGKDFKHLNYSGLGVAMGISLANKALNHEERIKILEKENKALKEEIRRIRYVE